MGLPIDSARLNLIAMSGARPAASFAELADGSTRYVAGQQGLDRASGLPLWEVDCVSPADASDERGRMTTLTVRIAAQHAPDVTPGSPVTFEGLTVSPRVGKRDGKLQMYWNASGVAGARARVQAAS